MTDQKDFKTLIKERFDKLPKPVQNAILSGDPEKRLRELSKEHQLHLDQWQNLENVIMLTLLGVYHSADIEKHIVEDVGVSEEKAHALAEDATKIVFEPIREQLERELEHPAAKEEKKSGVERVREQVMVNEQSPTSKSESRKSAADSYPIGTPPQPKSATKAERAPVSPVYKPRESSTERKSVEGDPYREPPQ